MWTCSVDVQYNEVKTTFSAGGLMFLNEATLLHNLRVRYGKNQIYVSLSPSVSLSLSLRLSLSLPPSFPPSLSLSLSPNH